jgi:metalloendopeptidase OMA1, mitochondrial
MWKYAVLCTAGVASSSLFSKNKHTGRWQMILIPESLDSYIGQLAKKILLDGSSTINENESPHKCVSDLCKALSPHVRVEKTWTVTVLENDTINAFVLPDGSIFVNTGLLKVLNTVDELGFVLAHELSHVILRHTAEKMTVSGLVAIFWIFIQFYVLGDIDLSVIGNVLINLPLSRTAESEADKQALKIMGQAGLEPEAGVAVMRIFEENAKNEQFEVLSTHPLSEHRAKDIEKEIEGMEKYKVKEYRELRKLFQIAKEELEKKEKNIGGVLRQANGRLV